MPYNCLYLNKGNNSSVKGSILTKLIGYREFIVLIICTKNESNLTNRYWDMVPDRQKVWTDGRTDGRTDDAKTISLRLRWGIKKIRRNKARFHCLFAFRWIPNTKTWNTQFKIWNTQLRQKEVGKYPIAPNPYLELCQTKILTSSPIRRTTHDIIQQSQ